MPKIMTTSAELGSAERKDHLLARLAWNRMGHIVKPGLYRVGKPDKDSPVFASANYTLSFDALRKNLKGIDCYILVLDTKGINVWCAAGKGTFGTQELIRRIKITELEKVVNHKKIILPQLAAPGIQAHVVHMWGGFRVEYGPVRADDIPKYMANGRTATREMRKATFPIKDRATLIPVEIVTMSIPTLIGAFAVFVLLGWLAAVGVIASVFAGIVLFPLLLPYIPTKEFASKGFIIGVVVILPLALLAIFLNPDAPLWLHLVTGAGYLLALPAITAYLGLNFTGSSTFTSRTGVRKEMYTYVPIMAFTFALGIVAGLVMAVVNIAEVVSRLI